MNIASLFHQFLKQAAAFVKDNSGKAVTCFHTLLNRWMCGRPAPRYTCARTVIIQRFLVLQHYVISANRAMLLHYHAYPL